MTTDTMFAIFENFNAPRDEPKPPPEQEPVFSGDIGQIREESWTDGYLTGCQQAAVLGSEPPSAATLLTSLHALEANAADAVDTASLAVADLLVNTVIATTSGDWSARLLDRVRIVADRIKPALMVAPEFVLRNEAGTEQHFADITDLSRALENGADAEGVTIRWRHGEAAIGRAALLEDMRDAIIPLSAGRFDETHARQPQ